VHLNNINSVIKDTSLLKDGNVFELKMQKDRQIITVEIGVFDIKKNSINLGKLLILEDVSEDRKIREEVKQTEAKFKAVVENSTDPIVMFSPLNGRFIFANDALSKLSKYSKDEIYNSFSLFDLLPKDYSGKEDLKKWLSEIARGDLTENATYESLLLTKDNKIIDIIVSTAIIQFDDDVAVVSVLKDISDRKRFEEEREMLILDLGRANSELKKLVEMKNDFLAVASHDLRSPFNSIIGFSDLLLDDDSLLEKHKKFISNINTSAKIQLEYINDLLDIIKMESGEVSLTKSKIKASTLINLSCDAIAILALQKNINIDIKIEDNITLQVDTPKIVQVLNNLISNAVKFTQKGGMITIKSYLKDEKVYFHIIDTGMGLEESKLKLLFKTYKQIYTKGTEGEKGTGLGLSICKKMVEAHGGEIFAKSVLNEGSDFYFYLYK
jgi:PAS domain S-box-containing protein